MAIRVFKYAVPILLVFILGVFAGRLSGSLSLRPKPPGDVHAKKRSTCAVQFEVNDYNDPPALIVEEGDTVELIDYDGNAQNLSFDWVSKPQCEASVDLPGKCQLKKNDTGQDQYYFFGCKSDNHYDCHDPALKQRASTLNPPG